MCLLEIGMTVWGIVVLATGKFSLTRKTQVTGGPAYVIGALLTATFPIAFGVGFVVGFTYAASTGKQPNMLDFWYLDPIIIGGILLAITAITLATRNSEPQTWVEQTTDQMDPFSFPPKDPDNPYAPPDQPQ